MEMFWDFIIHGVHLTISTRMDSDTAMDETHLGTEKKPGSWQFDENEEDLEEEAPDEYDYHITQACWGKNHINPSRGSPSYSL